MKKLGDTLETTNQVIDRHTRSMQQLSFAIRLLGYALLACSGVSLLYFVVTMMYLILSRKKNRFDRFSL